MDNIFYILRGLLEMINMGVYGSALIKKRFYLPRGVPGRGRTDKKLTSR